MKEYIAVNKKAYDLLAEEYLDKKANYTMSDREIAVPFISYLKEHFNPASVLELGPGSGLNLSFFEKEGFQTTALDISAAMIAVAKQTAPSTHFYQGNFLEFDFKEKMFSGIFAKAFIHLFTEEDAVVVLQRIYSLLKPKGAAFIATTVHEQAQEGFFEKHDYAQPLKRYRKQWREDELLKKIKTIGFTVFFQGYHQEKHLNKTWINLVVVKDAP